MPASVSALLGLLSGICLTLLLVGIPEPATAKTFAPAPDANTLALLERIATALERPAATPVARAPGVADADRRAPVAASATDPAALVEELRTLREQIVAAVASPRVGSAEEHAAFTRTLPAATFEARVDAYLEQRKSATSSQTSDFCLWTPHQVLEKFGRPTRARINGHGHLVWSFRRPNRGVVDFTFLDGFVAETSTTLNRD